MTDSMNYSFSNSHTSYDEAFFEILKQSARANSSEFIEYFNDFSSEEIICDYFKMLSMTTSGLSSDSSMIDSILEDNGRISLAYENLRNIPRNVAENYALETKFLDLSFNNFKNLSFLSFFKKLNTLILDKNSGLDETTFPYLPNLEILWINNCKIVNISKWIYRIKLNCPILRHLSLLGNPGAKTLLTGSTHLEEIEFRKCISDMLPNLKYLDGLLINFNDENIKITNPQQQNLLPNNKIRNNVIENRNFTTGSFRNLFRIRQRKSYKSSTS